MTVQWLPPASAHFARKVKFPDKIIPSEDTLNGCIAGLTKQIRRSRHPEKKQRLRDIREEIQSLKDAL